MQRARMPVPDGLFPFGRLVDGVERKGDFDEFFALLHVPLNRLS